VINFQEGSDRKVKLANVEYAKSQGKGGFRTTVPLAPYTS
jgi:hypothetical protein